MTKKRKHRARVIIDMRNLELCFMRAYKLILATALIAFLVRLGLS